MFFEEINIDKQLFEKTFISKLILSHNHCKLLVKYVQLFVNKIMSKAFRKTNLAGEVQRGVPLVIGGG